jgi:hypothetical protein
VTIEGADEVMKLFEEFPIKADKVVKEAMREASKTVAQNIRPKMPNKSFRKAVKYKIGEGKEYSFANVGILRPKKQGDQRFAWTKAYWKNFGTLANRDPSHKFIYPRKPKYGNRMGGIKPAHFFEPAMNGTDELWKNKFVETLKKKAKERKLLDE